MNRCDLETLYRNAEVGCPPHGVTDGRAIMKPGTAFTVPASQVTRLIWQGKVFTDDELKWLDRFVRNNTVSRHGPVREIEKTLVLEVAFDSIAASKRHKSGLAMRFPRIARIRQDKPAEEADRVETLLAMIDK